jgi:PAS domain S-box-containing protein
METITAYGEGKIKMRNKKQRVSKPGLRIKKAQVKTKQVESDEQSVRVSELNYRRLFESAKDGILILDADTGRINDVNPFLLKLLGFSRGEMIGRTVGELSPFKDIESNKVMLDRLQKVWYVRYENLPLEAKDGRKIAVEFVSNVYRVGDSYMIQCNIRDITERRNLEARYIEAQKMGVVGQLASGVAHDFNNILAVIMGYSGLMLEEPGLGAQFKDKLETIQSAAERAIGLSRQLLIFSRKQPVQPVILDLNDTVKDLDKMLRRLINENIEMMIVPGEQIGRIRADSGYVGQVLMNLVVNARDAMPNGGKLTISINNATLDENYARTHIGAVAGDYVMLSVGDTGTGMTDAIKAHMFEAFFTTKPEGRGTGLGLATCQTIMQQSGGHIDVDSKVGKGTTFKVYFPRVQHLLGVAPRPVQIGAAPETAPL